MYIPSRYDLMMGINARGTFLTYVCTYCTFDMCYDIQNITYMYVVLLSCSVHSYFEGKNFRGFMS